MAVISFTGRDSACTYKCVPFYTQLDWLKSLDIISLDTETNVVDSILQRKLTVISIADEYGKEMWVIEFEFLPPSQVFDLFKELPKKLCILQNVSFDYQILNKYGCTLKKVYDTMLAEQTIDNGLAAEQSYHGLQAILKRRFDMDISKEDQLSFGEGLPLTSRQIQYSAVDVYKLGSIRRSQMQEMMYEDKRIGQKGNKGLVKTMWWENEFVKVVGDMESAGYYIDKEKWYKVEDSIEPIWQEEKTLLNKIVIDEFYDTLEYNDWIAPQDRLVVKIWSSSAKKLELLSHIFDFPIYKTSQVELKKLLQENDPDFPLGLPLSGKAWASDDYPTKFTSKFTLIKLLILYSTNKDKIGDHLHKFVMQHMRDFGIEKGWIIPAYELTLNWASPIQRIKIFQAFNPSIDSTKKELLMDYIEEHKIVGHYLEWARVDYIKKSFGKAFYDKHVDLDGRFRSRFRQILATGRLSSTSPNSLGIPHDKMFRDCIMVQEENEILIGADYDQEELLITGCLAGEASWIRAFTEGLDLHSINAEVIYGPRWKNLTETNCEYYATLEDGLTIAQQKCNCKGHKIKRDSAKTVEFGYLYGLGAYSLAAKLKISPEEAKALIDTFSNDLPAIQAYMAKVKNFAIINQFIIEPVLGRIRYFDKWKFSVDEEIAGVERASGNYTIQGSGSSILKIAAVLIRRWIRHNNYVQAVRILLLVHDEVLISFRPKYLPATNEITLDEVKERVEHFMMLAGKLAGFSLLKASAASGEAWGSVH